jgi:hypothetical protein
LDKPVTHAARGRFDGGESGGATSSYFVAVDDIVGTTHSESAAAAQRYPVKRMTNRARFSYLKT